MSHRELRKAHRAELSKLEDNYKEALKAEKAAARGKLGTARARVKYKGLIVWVWGQGLPWPWMGGDQVLEVSS